VSLEQFQALGIGFVSLCETVDTSTPVITTHEHRSFGTGGQRCRKAISLVDWSALKEDACFIARFPHRLSFTD
jgi:hypothetical protein